MNKKILTIIILSSFTFSPLYFQEVVEEGELETASVEEPLGGTVVAKDPAGVAGEAPVVASVAEQVAPEKRMSLEELRALKEKLGDFLKKASKKARELEFSGRIDGKSKKKVVIYDYLDMRFYQLVNKILFRKFEPDEGFLYDDSGLTLQDAATVGTAIAARALQDLNKATREFIGTPEGKGVNDDILAGPLAELNEQKKKFDSAYALFKKNQDEDSLDTFREAKEERAELAKVVADAKAGVRKEALNYVFERVKGHPKESVADFLKREGARFAMRTKFFKKIAPYLEPFTVPMGMTPEELIEAFSAGKEAGMKKVAAISDSLEQELIEKQKAQQAAIAAEVERFDREVKAEVAKTQEEIKKTQEEIEKAKQEAKAGAAQAEAETRAEVARAEQEAKEVVEQAEQEAVEEVAKTEAEIAEEAARAEQEAAEAVEQAEQEAVEEVAKTEAEIAEEAARAEQETAEAVEQAEGEAVEEVAKTEAEIAAEAARAEQEAAEAVEQAEQEAVEEVAKTEAEAEATEDVEAAGEAIDEAGTEGVEEEVKREAAESVIEEAS